MSIPCSGDERTVDERHLSRLGISVDGRPLFDAPVLWRLVHDYQLVSTVLQRRQTTVESRFPVGDGSGTVRQRLHNEGLVLVDTAHQMTIQLGSWALYSVTT